MISTMAPDFTRPDFRGALRVASRAGHAALASPMQAIVTRLARTEPDAPLAGAGPEIDAEIARMRAHPVPLKRPVVILSGYRAWPVMAETLRTQVAALTSGNPDDILPISYTLRGDLDDAANLAQRRVDRWLRDRALAAGTSIDVIGISMGGLVARRAAMRPEDGQAPSESLNIHRLFTLATPHRGARLAEMIAPDAAARSMRPGSPLLRALDRAIEDRPYDLVPYAVLNDTWVGATRTAPPGYSPIWTAGARTLSHFTVSEVRGIIADICARLRGDPPLAALPSAPPRD